MDARKIISAIYDALSLMKGFEVGYSTDTFKEGRMIIDYEGKRYAVKLEEVKNPSADMSDDLDRLKWLV